MDKINLSERINISVRISEEDRMKLIQLSTNTKRKFARYKSQSDFIHEALQLFFKKYKI